MKKTIGISLCAILLGTLGCDSGPQTRLKKQPSQKSPAPERIVLPDAPQTLPPITITSQSKTLQPMVITAKTPVVDKKQPLPKKVDPLGNVPKKLPNLRVVRVQRGETPGLLAGWSGVSVEEILRWNKMTLKSKLKIGQELTLVADEDQWGVFKQKRVEFHKSREDRFFDRFKVDTLNVYTIRKGDSLHRIARKYGKIPLWVIKKFNKNKSLKRLRIGETIFVPQLVPVQTKQRLAKVRNHQLPNQANYTGLIIRVKPGESMKLCARWSGLSSTTIWRVNRMTRGTLLVAGQRLMLPLSDRGVNSFLSRRLAFHKLRRQNVSHKKSVRIAQRYNKSVRFYLDQERKQKQRLLKKKKKLARKNRVQTRKLRRLVNREVLQRRHKVKRSKPRVRLRGPAQPKPPRKKQLIAKNGKDKRVKKVIRYKMAKGDIAWVIATKKYKISLKMLQKYNKNKNLDRLREGEVINIPITAAY